MIDFMFDWTVVSHDGYIIIFGIVIDIKVVDWISKFMTRILTDDAKLVDLKTCLSFPCGSLKTKNLDECIRPQFFVLLRSIETWSQCDSDEVFTIRNFELVKSIKNHSSEDAV